jgi:hypothetical protein
MHLGLPWANKRRDAEMEKQAGSRRGIVPAAKCVGSRELRQTAHRWSEGTSQNQSGVRGGRAAGCRGASMFGGTIQVRQSYVLDSVFVDVVLTLDEAAWV